MKTHFIKRGPESFQSLLSTAHYTYIRTNESGKNYKNNDILIIEETNNFNEETGKNELTGRIAEFKIIQTLVIDKKKKIYDFILMPLWNTQSILQN